MAKRCLVPLEYLVNLNSHSNFKFEGKNKIYRSYVGSVPCLLHRKENMVVTAVKKLMGENLKLVPAEFLTLSLAVLLS